MIIIRSLAPNHRRTVDLQECFLWFLHRKDNLSGHGILDGGNVIYLWPSEIFVDASRYVLTCLFTWKVVDLWSAYSTFFLKLRNIKFFCLIISSILSLLVFPKKHIQFLGFLCLLSSFSLCHDFFHYFHLCSFLRLVSRFTDVIICSVVSVPHGFKCRF